MKYILAAIILIHSSCLTQIKYKKNKSKYLIENKIFINRQEDLITQNLSVTLTDSTGKEYTLPANKEFVDIANIPYINGSYKASLEYSNYRIDVDIPTKMFLSQNTNSKKNEAILWEWYISKKTINDTLQVSCTFLLTLQDSWIELEIPANVDYGSK